MKRTITFNTETTGLSLLDGHRIIEIGAVEIIDDQITGRQFHTHLQPGRTISPETKSLTGITEEMLAGKPEFGEKAEELLDFLRGSEVVIHNSAYHTGFLNHELHRWDGHTRIEDVCKVTCSLERARKLYPGQRVSLGSLLKRLDIRNDRASDSALEYARLLAQIWPAIR